MGCSCVLASASPRRREILERLGLSFIVDPAASEYAPPGLPPNRRVLELARGKAEEVAARHPDAVVIGADTMVVIDGKALGKPADPQQAVAMLLQLQGRSHEVLTGVWICGGGRASGFVDRTEVIFYPMTRQQADAYVATGEPMDKAGAYGIQGIGMRYIRGIHGDFYTVMGLPGARLLRVLQEEWPTELEIFS